MHSGNSFHLLIQIEYTHTIQYTRPSHQTGKSQFTLLTKGTEMLRTLMIIKCLNILIIIINEGRQIQ